MIDEKIQQELRARFNPEGSQLRQHQLRMLKMLKYFDELCQKHGIRYWLSSGNCLGLVRHGGFIPWDDDIDVEMLREDYLKLEKVFKETDDYVLQTWKNDRYYHHPFAKMRDKHSIIVEENVKIPYKYKGVFIDVFIIERAPRSLCQLCAYLRWKCILPLYSSKSKSRRLLYILSKHLYYTCMPIVRVLSSWWPKNKYRHTYGVGWLDNTRDIVDIFPLQRAEFDGVEVYVPNDIKSYLKKIYGDYMQLPSEDNLPIPHASKIHFI